MGRRRFFRYGELPLVLLALLDHRPMGGYDLMAELDRLFGPAYRASPGSVYPALKALAAEELVLSTNGSSGSAETYVPSDAGRQALEDRRDDLAAVEQRTGRQLVRGDEVERALDRLGARVRQLAGRVDTQAVAAELDRALAAIEHEAARTPHPSEGST